MSYHEHNSSTKGGDASSLNGKIEIPKKTLASITRALLLNSIHNNVFGAFTIIIPSGSPTELIIAYVVMILTSFGVDQDLCKTK